MIPSFQDVMRPMLALLARRGEMRIQDVIDELAVEMELTEADLAERIPSNYQGKWQNRVYWAKTYLGKARAVDTPRHGIVAPNARTRELLAADPERVDVSVLNQFPEYTAWRASSRSSNGSAPDSERIDVPATDTPTERLDSALAEIRAGVLLEIEEQLTKITPEEFEHLVVRVLLALGYGARGSGQHLGRSGDGGVDGVINEDRLGLDRIYLQAKKYSEAKIGRPEVQKFVGSLVGQRARKGVFITTSNFSEEARRYAESTDFQVVLIGGEELARLMFEANVGVVVDRTIEIKSVNFDFFESGLR